MEEIIWKQIDNPVPAFDAETQQHYIQVAEAIGENSWAVASIWRSFHPKNSNVTREKRLYWWRGHFSDETGTLVRIDSGYRATI